MKCEEHCACWEDGGRCCNCLEVKPLDVVDDLCDDDGSDENQEPEPNE